ncbi:MAG: tetratricopeptide repeat protein [Bryobacteraceae bacterium]
MFRRLCIGALPASVFCGFVAFVTVSAPRPARAASKEIEELQRDVAQLQDQLKQLQQSQDRQLAEIRTLVQQSLSAGNDANKSVAVIQNGLQQSLRDLQEKVVTPVVGVGSRMDQVSSDLRTLQAAVSDLTNMVSKLQTQLSDLSNVVKVLSAPPPPPPSQTGTAPGGSAPDLPTISATDLYANADRDRLGGKLDLALSEFSDYLRWYGNTDMAPFAQYYIGWIHASQGDYDNAVKDYDLVLEKYQDNRKTPDALFGKGQALVKLGRRTDANKEFQELLKRFPRNDLAPRACDQVKSLGFNCGSAAAATRKKKQE